MSASDLSAVFMVLFLFADGLADSYSGEADLTAPEENRPLYYHSFAPFQRAQRQQAAYSQRQYEPYQQRVDSDYYSAYDRDYRGARSSDSFGVLKGGTFYRDDGDHRNGHSKPQYYDNPRPQNHEQFDDFRDFADINAPSYSEYVVVYSPLGQAANRSENRPNNVLESLRQIDEAKKISKHKRKLALEDGKMESKLMRLKAKSRTKDDNVEPLLALS